jgi:dihydrodipicolinate reductase
MVNPNDYVLAKNMDTGKVMEIRPEMLELDDFNWQILEDHREKKKETKSGFAKKTEEVKPIRKADGSPFSTEESARSAMTRKELSEDEYMIVPVAEGGFEIRKL